MELLITKIDSKRIRAVSSPTGKVFSDLTLAKHSVFVGKPNMIPHLHAVEDDYEPPLLPSRTVFTRYEILKAVTKIPELYEQLKGVYQQNVDIALWWNSVNDIDINNEDFQTLCAQIGITDEIIANVIKLINE